MPPLPQRPPAPRVHNRMQAGALVFVRVAGRPVPHAGTVRQPGETFQLRAEEAAALGAAVTIVQRS